MNCTMCLNRLTMEKPANYKGDGNIEQRLIIFLLQSLQYIIEKVELMKISVELLYLNYKLKLTFILKKMYCKQLNSPHLINCVKGPAINNEVTTTSDDNDGYILQTNTLNPFKNNNSGSSTIKRNAGTSKSTIYNGVIFVRAKREYPQNGSNCDCTEYTYLLNLKFLPRLFI